MDLLYDTQFEFESGKTYGLIGEYGSGGWALSRILSGQEPIQNEKIFLDDVQMPNDMFNKLGWYVGKPIYSAKFIRKEKTVKQCLIESKRGIENIVDIMKDFHLSEDRLDYGITNLGYEGWRASLAIGFVKGKKIFAFPYMDTSMLYDIMTIGGIYMCLDKLKENGSIIILPTSREENVHLIADEIVKLCNPRFKLKCSENEYVKDYYANKK